MARLTIRGLRKSYGKVQALRGIDLDIAEGEFCVFVGPSGCGKSTLLRTIAGPEDTDGGTIEIDSPGEGGTTLIARVPAGGHCGQRSSDRAARVP